MAGLYDLATLRRSLPLTIRWLNDNIRDDRGGKPRIVINVVDGCDAFADNAAAACEILSLLADQPIEGVSLEDDRGTYMPFQVGAFVGAARSLLPPPLKLLVHMHSGGGFENASLIEALLQGGRRRLGRPPQARGDHRPRLAGGAHREPRSHRQSSYAGLSRRTIAAARDVAPARRRRASGPRRSADPGKERLRLMLDFFRQKPARFMDLPPEAIGGRYGYRICPLAADPPVIAGRLAEVTGRPAGEFPEEVLLQMVRLMRRDLRAGLRLVYDEPEQLMHLYVRAGGGAQSKAGVDHEADYRALTRDGSYVWLRDVVHVVRTADGAVEALVGFMFDISERKKTEEKLLNLQKELQDLSFKDGLTGLANRRRFDSLVYLEWDASRRNERPLSILMIDIDFFKQYNDHYGHIQGDECLKRVANALSSGSTRARDFLARYGGEEFALVLPDTDEKGAAYVAASCRDALSAERIPHETSSVAPTVTVSIGVGTLVPSAADELVHFIEEVDRRLYRAKQGGRNALVVGRAAASK